MPIRVAVVGTGAISRGQHLPSLAALGDRVEVVAVCDVNADAARAAAAEFGIPAWYSDLDALLAAESPQFVTLATPPVAHRDAAIAALRAGAWVLSEKPPTLSLADYDAIAEHEGEDGPFASYVFQHRFGSAAVRLRELIADGSLGRPLVARCDTLWYRDPAYFAVPWRGKWATEGGGPTMGHGIHQVDMLLSLLGEWTDVSAVMSTLARETDTEDVSMASVRFASGAMCSITNSLLSPRETSAVRIDFERATVEVEHLYGYDNAHWRWTPAPGVPAEEAASWAPRENVASDSHAPQFAQVIAAMERGERPVASGDDGRRIMELAAGMYKSALEGRSVGREELVPGDPFYGSMAGSDPADATARIHAGTIRSARPEAARV
ncbi:Gfo/Idh/MocA family protein [Microbacterium excoecariae]|uniref:Gfo/Idh/MocA family protein n=1 Tax=Microbacterium excoecariae TaxID=2715210 RepID=UPI00140A4DD2|nr:Gfo/Idh/MocA family oxidoreductase [Microbacterium excoecariae]NHI15686.1 Gfo/Idh/MocA family oxidoreductase [Microbacterium excoecariae]